MEVRSYSFPTFSGLLTPEHKERMGAAVWEFLWCVDRTTKEYIKDGELRGKVLGGKPVKADDIANDLGGNPRHINRNLQRLFDLEYIDLKRAPYGQIIEVRKSKKFINRGNKKVPSSERPYEKVPSENQREYKKVLSRGYKIGTSNKTLQLDITKKMLDRKIDGDTIPQGECEGILSSRGSVPQQISLSPVYRIEKYLAKKMQVMNISTSDFQTIENLLKSEIPEEVITDGIDRSFENFKPSYEGERIRSIKYCEPAIRQIHSANSERERAAQEVASGITKDPPQYRQRGQRNKPKSEYLQKIIAAEEENAKRRAQQREKQSNDLSDLPF